MENLELTIIEFGGEPRADSRELAQMLGIQHRNLISLARSNVDDISDFGKVTFETRPSESGQMQNVVMLNEDQCIFLLALSRNTKESVSLKKKLVKAFSKYRNQGMMIPSADMTLTQAIMQQHELLGRAIAVLDSHENRITAMEQRAEEAEKALMSPSAPVAEAPPKADRAAVNEIVRDYAAATGIHYGVAWKKLYRELYSRCGINVQLQAKRRGVPALDIVEEKDLMLTLYAIAYELFANQGEVAR